MVKTKRKATAVAATERRIKAVKAVKLPPNPWDEYMRRCLATFNPPDVVLCNLLVTTAAYPRVIAGLIVDYALVRVFSSASISDKDTKFAPYKAQSRAILRAQEEILSQSTSQMELIKELNKPGPLSCYLPRGWSDVAQQRGDEIVTKSQAIITELERQLAEFNAFLNYEEQVLGFLAFLGLNQSETRFFSLYLSSGLVGPNVTSQERQMNRTTRASWTDYDSIRPPMKPEDVHRLKVSSIRVQVGDCYFDTGYVLRGASDESLVPWHVTDATSGGFGFFEGQSLALAFNSKSMESSSFRHVFKMFCNRPDSDTTQDHLWFYTKYQHLHPYAMLVLLAVNALAIEDAASNSVLSTLPRVKGLEQCILDYEERLGKEASSASASAPVPASSVVHVMSDDE